MAAPLRRVFSKHSHRISSLLDHAAMTAALPFCIRCSKPMFSSVALNGSRKQLVWGFKGLSTKHKTLSNHCPEWDLKQTFFHVSSSTEPNSKLIYRNRCNHEHLLNCSNFISRETSINRRLSSHNSHRPRNTKNISVPKHENSGQNMFDSESKRLQSDVLCKNTSSGHDTEPHRSKVLSPKENIYTIPNLLTLGRMLSAPFLGFMVMNEYFEGALGLFAFAGVSDLLDGYIARNFKNQNSILGSALDPMADKILISVLTLTLTAVNLIPFPLTTLIVGRDLGLIGATFYLRYISLPPPKTLSRYFDVTLVSAKLEPFTVSKWNTAFQLSLVALTLAAPVFHYVDHPLLQGLWYLTGATTFISGMQYLLFWKDSVKILQPEKKK